MSKAFARTAFADAQPIGSFVVPIIPDLFKPSLLAGTDGIFHGDSPSDEGSAQDEASFIDPVETAYVAGREEGMRLAAQMLDADRAALAAMLAQLPGIVPGPTDALAHVLAVTVEKMVRDIMGQVAIDPAFLAERAEKIAALVGQALEPVRLHLHPDDINIVRDACPDITLVADRARARGSLLLESGHGWFEDGPEQRLAALRAELDKMGCGA